MREKSLDMSAPNDPGEEVELLERNVAFEEGDDAEGGDIEGGGEKVTRAEEEEEGEVRDHGVGWEWTVGGTVRASGWMGRSVGG